MIDYEMADIEVLLDATLSSERVSNVGDMETAGTVGFVITVQNS